MRKVPLIENQIHDALIAVEEERCLKKEAELRQQGKPAQVKRSKIAKPWKREGVARCQDIDLLLHVSAHCYDLDDLKFREYARIRGVMHVAGLEGSRQWDFFRDTHLPFEDYERDPDLRLAIEWEGARRRFTDADMRTLWKTVLIGRAALQDCWELFVSVEP